MPKPNLRPLNDWCVVEQSTAESVSQGGIILPDQAQKKPLKGTVVAVGLGRRNDDGRNVPMSVREGDSVFFDRYGAEEIEHEGRKLLMLQEVSLRCVIGK